MYMRPADWLQVVTAEYLSSFVRSSGAAVKFAVPKGESERSELQAGLREAASAAGYEFAAVDSAVSRIHMMDRIFHVIGGQLDWLAGAGVLNRGLLSSQGYTVPPSGPAHLPEVAELSQLPESMVRLGFQQALSRAVTLNPVLSQDFRMAATRLCMAALDPSWVNPAQVDALHQWLTGELRGISALRGSLIYQKIARHNARQMLFSLPHWLRLTGKSGLVLLIDAYQLVAQRPRGLDEVGARVYYTRASVMEAYELLRQLIDNADELQYTFIVVSVAPEMLDPLADRGIAIYQALRNRIWDDVRDRRKPNPLSSLIRLDRTAEPLVPQYAITGVTA